MRRTMVEQILSTPETLNLALETWFIQDTLFGGVPFSLNLGGKMIGSPVVYLEFKNINLDFVRHVKSTGSKLVLFHMADELGDADISAYAQCDLVVRNYFFQTIMDSPEHADKLIWAPNGFRTGVGPRDRASLRKAGARTCLAAFAGWLANPQSHGGERARFAEAIPNCGANLFCHATIGFGAGYSLGLYAAVLEDSIFAPCPAGNSPETIRLYDALEMGCIPISLSHPFLTSPQALAAMGPVPFPLLKTWDHLPEFLDGMKATAASHPAQIVAMQSKCVNWWKDYKSFMQKRIATRCQELAGGKGNLSLRSLAQRLSLK
jgi:hypothetical protein